MHRITCICLALGLATGTAAVAEAAGPINVTQLAPACSNADGSDGLDDTAAFTCAIGLVPAAGYGEIYVPAGTYILSSQLTISGKSIAFRGEGQRITNLRFVNLPNGHNGLDFASSNVTTHQTFAVRSLSVLRANGDGGNAIHAAWPNTAIGQPDFANGGGVSITIEDVHIGTDSWTVNGPFWHRGIWLHNPRFAKIHTFNIHGLPEATAGIAGIQISGSQPESPGSQAIGVAIHDGSILGYIRGVHAVEGTRSLNAQNLKIRDALWGFELLDIGTGTSIANCRISAYWRGITAYNTLGEMAISNNVIDRTGTDAFYGIELNTGPAGPMPRMRIIGNTITAVDTGSARYGISMANSVNGAVVEGNTTNNMTIGIWLFNPSVTGSMVLGNRNRPAAGGAQITNGGTSTYLMHNW